MKFLKEPFSEFKSSESDEADRPSMDDFPPLPLLIIEDKSTKTNQRDEWTKGFDPEALRIRIGQTGLKN